MLVVLVVLVVLVILVVFVRLAVSAAETSARRGEISLARLRYSEAAKHVAKAAGVFPPNGAYEDKRISYLLIRCRVLAVKIANELRNKRPV